MTKSSRTCHLERLYVRNVTVSQLLTATDVGLDGRVKIWDAVGSYKCMRTYLGHSKGVKDINFTNDGRKFVSVGYDRNIRLWDTETGQVGCLLGGLLAI